MNLTLCTKHGRDLAALHTPAGCDACRAQHELGQAQALLEGLAPEGPSTEDLEWLRTHIDSALRCLGGLP